MSTLQGQAEQALSVPRVRAFLDTIGRSEGATYNTLVGGGKFSDFSHHPLNKPGIKTVYGYSTASGKYQYLRATWNGVATALGLKDFTPHSQDLGAVELLRQRKALPFLLDSNLSDADAFQKASYAARNEWASLPASQLGQHRQNYNTLLSYFQKALGSVEQATGAAVEVVRKNPGTSAGIGVGTIALAVVVGLLVSRDS